MNSSNPEFWPEAPALMNVIPVGIFRIDRDNKLLFANNRLLQLVGFSSEELIGAKADVIFPNAAEFRSIREDAAEQGMSAHSEVEVLTKTKKTLICSVSLVAVKEGKGSKFFDGVVQDLSTIKRAEKDLRESKELFQSVFNNSAAAIIVVDETEKITAWNSSVQEMLGMDKIDLFNKPVAELFPIREWDRISAISRKNKGRVTEVDTQLYHKDGKRLSIGLSLSFIKDDEGKKIGSIVIMRDMTAQKAAERKLRESESKIRIILDHSAAAIILTDEQERIISWNKHTEAMLGRKHEDLYLKPVSILYPAEEWEKIRAADIRKTGSKHHFQTKALKADNSSLDVELSVNMLKDSNDNIVGSVGILQDITEQKHLQDMLVKAKTVAEDANQSKSQFLANMSHEVRTPMNTIIGLVDLTLDTQLSPEQRDNLMTIKNAGDILLSLLNDILDLSRVEAGKIQLEHIEVNVNNVIQSVCKGLAVLARNKNLALVWEIAPEVPPTIIGDPVRIRQILVNLINNAIKFTFQGQITTKVELLDLKDGICELRFAVRDQGVGIPQDKLETVFEAFTQADASTTRRFGGTGLGLTISKRLVEMMGGKIWVESEEFKGSTFIFTGKFKVAEASAVVEEQQPVEVKPRSAEKTEKALRILLAEDNVVNQRIAAKMLEKRGWFVKGAENGKQVLEYLDKEPFDLILMDAQMPVLDGFEATRLIRESEKKSGKHIPIIALTAHAMAGDRQKCLDAGMDGYVSKPIDRQKLYEAVETLV